MNATLGFLPFLGGMVALKRQANDNTEIKINTNK